MLTLHALFGAPEAVAAQGALTIKAHAWLLSWLRCAEAMLRRLVLIEAAAVAKPVSRACLTRRRQRAPKLSRFNAENPEAWPVSFRCFPADARPPARSHMRRPEDVSEAPRVRSAWPLAERYEALIRVFNDPAAFARRAARRLYALPRLLSQALRAPPHAAARVERFAVLAELIAAIWPPRFSSA